MDFDELNDAMAKSNARARRGRRLAGLMFSMTAAVVGFVAFSALLYPPCGGMMCPLFIDPPGLITNENVTKLGFGGLAVGLLWMWRIVRADRDPDSRSWRYRR